MNAQTKKENLEGMYNRLIRLRDDELERGNTGSADYFDRQAKDVKSQLDKLGDI